jgi:hypothetical protein
VSNVRTLRRWLMLLVCLAGCEVTPRTEIMVRIEGDDIIRQVTRSVDIDVFGGERSSDVPSEVVIEIPFPIEGEESWPITHGVIPRDNDASRRFRFEATARDEFGDFVAHTRAISVFVKEQTRVLTLRFYAACLHNEMCVASLAEFCDENGQCSDARRDPDPPDGGVVGLDAGAPRDAAGLDAADLDAGSIRDGAVPSDAGAPCTSSSECTAGSECSPGVCTATGCRYDPVEDGRGCTDDGVYCNGNEECRAGLCAHTGDPCLGGTTCSEAMGTCTGCGGAGTCPTTTEWSGSCASTGGPCGRTGTEFGWTTVSTCVDGMCVSGAGSMVGRPCDRGETDGILCGPGPMCPCAGMCTTAICFAVQCMSEVCRSVPTGATLECPCSDGGRVFLDASL